MRYFGPGLSGHRGCAGLTGGHLADLAATGTDRRPVLGELTEFSANAAAQELWLL
jgi:hypothetical protein